MGIRIAPQNAAVVFAGSHWAKTSSERRRLVEDRSVKRREVAEIFPRRRGPDFAAPRSRSSWEPNSIFAISTKRSGLTGKGSLHATGVWRTMRSCRAWRPESGRGARGSKPETPPGPPPVLRSAQSKRQSPHGPRFQSSQLSAVSYQQSAISSRSPLGARVAGEGVQGLRVRHGIADWRPRPVRPPARSCGPAPPSSCRSGWPGWREPR